MDWSLHTGIDNFSAQRLYEKFGFTYLSAAQGNSGHTGCDVWMLKELV
jgi:putative acetyltransferase